MSVVKDYQVEAAYAAWCVGTNETAREAIRKVLEAAAAAVEPEPEITVTENQLRMAVAIAQTKYQQRGHDGICTVGGIVNTQLGRMYADIYRAMRKLDPDLTRRKPREPSYLRRCPQGYNLYSGHVTWINTPNTRKGERRSDLESWAGIRGSGNKRSRHDRRHGTSK